MPRQVSKARGNGYCEARLRAAKYNEQLNTRAGAAELIPGVTAESLRRYELDITNPPNDVVAIMADVYGAPELRTWYCANRCPLGGDCREIPDGPAERTVIRAHNQLQEISAAINALMQALDDGELDESEAKEIPEIRKQVLEGKQRMEELLTVIDHAQKRGNFD